MWYKESQKKRYFHASPKLFKPGDTLTPPQLGSKKNFNLSQEGWIYLTTSPKPHYTVANLAMKDGWEIYEVRPYDPKRIWLGICWDEYLTDRPCEIINRVGNARGIAKAGKPDKKKIQEEQSEWLRERIKEAKDAMLSDEARKKFMDLHNYGDDPKEWINTPEYTLEKYQNELKYKNPDTSKVLYKRLPFRGLPK